MLSSSALRMPSGSGRRAAGILAAAAITALIGLIFWALQNTTITRTGSTIPVDIPHLLRMSAIQAGLTTLISVVAGIAIAWSLDRLKFPGKPLLVGLFASAIVTPGVVVAFGLITIWGRAGWANTVLNAMGLSVDSSIFGLYGILLAHLILDGTFAARILLSRLDANPATRLKTGRSLGLGAVRRFMVLDWPAMRGAIPGLSAIIFLLAFTSFPIVLLLGGGPANQTLEVAIYSSVRLNFDLGAAVALSLTQLVVCTATILPALAFPGSIAPAGNTNSFFWPDRWSVRVLQIAILGLGTIGFILPLLAVLVGGVSANLPVLMARPNFWQALGTSVSVGVSGAVLTLALGLAITLARTNLKSRIGRTLIGLPAYTYLVVPSVVLSLGFFLLTRSLGLRPQSVATLVLILASALLALPFALAILGPAVSAVAGRYDKLSRSLALTGWLRWRLVEWPLITREIGIVLAMGFCFSLNDVGVISLFGTDSFTTLPWLMVRALGAYRSNDAAIIAAILLTLCLTTFWLLPYLFGKLSNAQD